MPSGTEPPDYEEILPHPRWHRLAAGFREVGALLVLAAPASAPHIEDLVAAADGACSSGDAAPRSSRWPQSSSSVRETGQAQRAPSSGRPTAVTTRRCAVVQAPAPRWLAGHSTFVLVAIGADGWRIVRSLVTREPSTGPNPRYRAGRWATAPSAARPNRSAGMRPADSATAATAVPRVSEPAGFGASGALRRRIDGCEHAGGRYLEAAAGRQESAGRDLLAGARFRARAGSRSSAARSRPRAGADSLLARSAATEAARARERHRRATAVRVPDRLRRPAGGGTRNGRRSMRTGASRCTRSRRPNGTAWLLAGAFESLEQSTLYAESLRASGITPGARVSQRENVLVRLTKLEMHGFKSFADSTEMRVRAGRDGDRRAERLRQVERVRRRALGARRAARAAAARREDGRGDLPGIVGAARR